MRDLYAGPVGLVVAFRESAEKDFQRRNLGLRSHRGSCATRHCMRYTAAAVEEPVKPAVPRFYCRIGRMTMYRCCMCTASRGSCTQPRKFPGSYTGLCSLLRTARCNPRVPTFWLSDPASLIDGDPDLTAAMSAAAADELAGLDRVLTRLATTEDSSLEKVRMEEYRSV